MGDEFLDRISQIKEKTKHRKNISVVSYSPDFEVMAGKTLLNDLLGINHIQNSPAIKGLNHWPRVSIEALLQWNPSHILLSCLPTECPKAKKAVSSDKNWSRLTAVKEGRYILTEPRALSTTSHYFGTFIDF
jgi:ABC-type Fe3+-hydroxamate transport system substrate-binding protein